MFKFDLRTKTDPGRVIEINLFNGLMWVHCFYRFDGVKFIRILSHKNVDYVTQLKKEFTPKEFKETFEQLDKSCIKYVGIMRLD